MHLSALLSRLLILHNIFDIDSKCQFLNSSSRIMILSCQWNGHVNGSMRLTFGWQMLAWIFFLSIDVHRSLKSIPSEVLPHRLRVWLLLESEWESKRERERGVYFPFPLRTQSHSTRRLRDLRQQCSRALLPRQSRITRLVVPSRRLPLPESRACRIPGRTLTWNRSCASAGDGSATPHLPLLPVTSLREISSAAAVVAAGGPEAPHPAVISHPLAAAIAPAPLPVPARVTATLPPTSTTIESLQIRVQTVTQRRQWWLMPPRVLGPWASKSAGAPRRRLGSSRLTRALARAWSRSNSSSSSSSRRRRRRSSSPRVYQTPLALETRRTIITWSLTPARAGMGSITGVVPVEHSRALVLKLVPLHNRCIASCSLLRLNYVTTSPPFCFLTLSLYDK